MRRTALVAAVMAGLARWDRDTAHRADRYVAISHYVAGRIRRYYNREATVVYPPVDTDFFHPDAARPERFALVTGRRFRDARPLALSLGLDVPVIAHNGALTKHARTLETVNAVLMPVGAALAVVRLGRAHGADALVSDDHVGAGLLVYDHITEGNTALAKYIAWSRRVVGEDAAQAIRRVPSLEDYLDHDPLHVAFSGGCAGFVVIMGRARSSCVRRRRLRTRASLRSG